MEKRCHWCGRDRLVSFLKKTKTLVRYHSRYHSRRLDSLYICNDDPTECDKNKMINEYGWEAPTAK